jgi:hypothetical protein
LDVDSRGRRPDGYKIPARGRGWGENVPREHSRGRGWWFFCPVGTGIGKHPPTGNSPLTSLVPHVDTRQKVYFAMCFLVCRVQVVSDTRQNPLCRVLGLCRRSFTWHTANMLFAECPRKCSRQMSRQSATSLFPVVCYLNYLYCNLRLSMLFGVCIPNYGTIYGTDLDVKISIQQYT